MEGDPCGFLIRARGQLLWQSHDRSQGRESRLWAPICGLTSRQAGWTVCVATVEVISSECLLGERQVKAYPRIQTDPRTVGKTNRRRVIGAFRKPLYGITLLTVQNDTPCQHIDTPCQHGEARRGRCRR